MSGLLLCASPARAAEPAADAASVASAASAAASATISAADNAAAVAGCANMLAIIERSLEEELGKACAAPASIPAAATACAAQQEPPRAIADYIGKRRAAAADACETLLEVNKRLRTLPPKH
ncbi:MULTISPECIES: hypothetical protein [Cupriavidus]